MHFNLNQSLKQPEFDNTNCKIVVTKVLISFKLINDCKIQSSMNENEMNFQYLEYLDVEFLNSNFELKEAVLSIEESSAEKSSSNEENTSEVNTSSEGLILKELPEYLKYAFLEAEKSKPVIISADLIERKEMKLLEVLMKYKETIAWSIDDLKGINPSICMHNIMLEENAKTSIEHQRRLNPMMKEVVIKEVLKWFNAGFKYVISDNP